VKSAAQESSKQNSWTGRNFATVAIILVIATLSAALIFADLSVEAIVTRGQQEAISDELEALVAIANEEGSPALHDALELRSRLTSQHFMHLLINPAGVRVVGDMQAWPKELKQDDTWTKFTFTRNGGRPETAFGLSSSLPDGSRVMIARDVEVLARVRVDVLRAFGAALLFAVGVALAIGYALDRLVVSRVRAFVTTAESVMAGRLSARVPIGDERDELAELGRTLNVMLDRVQSLMNGMRAVTDSLAHDLRTPLTRLTGNLEAAQTGGEAERQAAIAAAYAEGHRLKQTFETLIDIARAETGLSRETMRETDLSELVADMVDLFEPLAEDRGLTLACVAEPISMLAHRALLGQAIGNLIDNSIKYAPPDGAIEVRLNKTPDGAEIVVADNGPGIPDGERSLAVQRFQRLARDADAPGTGLGLSIVSAAAHLHGGRLRLEDNAPGLRAVIELHDAPSDQPKR
jgi:signal transduction histidine kinase